MYINLYVSIVIFYRDLKMLVYVYFYFLYKSLWGGENNYYYYSSLWLGKDIDRLVINNMKIRKIFIFRNGESLCLYF